MSALGQEVAQDAAFDVEAEVDRMRQRWAKTFGNLKQHQVEPLAEAMSRHMGDQAEDLVRALIDTMSEEQRAGLEREE